MRAGTLRDKRRWARQQVHVWAGPTPLPAAAPSFSRPAFTALLPSARPGPASRAQILIISAHPPPPKWAEDPDIFQKKRDDWPRSSRKVAHHHYSSGKCKSQPVSSHFTPARAATRKEQNRKRNQERVGEDAEQLSPLRCWWDGKWGRHRGGRSGSSSESYPPDYRSTWRFLS